MSEQRPVDQVFPLLLGLGDQLQKRQESGGRDSHPAEESRAWKMSLSANFPEEPWLRLRAGNGKCAGRRRQPCSPPSGELFAKSCWERQGGESRGEGARSGRPRIWPQPKAWSLGRGGAGVPELPASSLGSPALPAPAMPCPPVWASAILKLRRWQTQVSGDCAQLTQGAAVAKKRGSSYSQRC